MANRFYAAAAVFVLLACSSAAFAQDASKTGRSLDPFYERAAADLVQGEPLVIVAHYGMWHVRATEPERNLNWGVYYGHATMMRRARKDGHIAKNYKHHDWRLVFEREEPSDPLRTLVFAQTVAPNARWKAAGVVDPIRVYLVMHAHADQAGAALAATRNMRRDEGEQITLDDGTRLDTGKAQATGYFGHNFFYDYEGFQWDGFAAVTGDVARPKGIFAVGCNTGRVPGFDDWVVPNAFALLFSRSLMASEGYSTLALADGVLRHMTGAELVAHGDRTYQYFQKLGKPERRVGRPFVSHPHKLYD